MAARAGAPVNRWSVWVWLDVAIAALLVILGELELRYTSGAHWGGLGHALMILPQVLAVAIRHLRPAAAVTISLATMMIEDVTFGATSTASVLAAALLLAYTLGRLTTGRRFVVVLCLSGVVMLVHAYVMATHQNDEPADNEFAIDTAFELVVLGGAVSVGRFIRHREETSVVAVAAAVADERARIARELHDVVAHGMGVMVVQAAAAEQLLESDPAKARQPLTTVRETGQDALAEMRRLLGLLREGGDDRTAPQPELSTLPSLVERLRESGLPVTLDVTGTPVAVPQGLGVSAYRIVQEALTNVLKHAGPVATSVEVAWSTDRLHLRVRNQPGHAPVSDGAGHGLIGMRERVRLYAGTLDASRQPDGTFLVDAMLPVAA